MYCMLARSRQYYYYILSILWAPIVCRQRSRNIYYYILVGVAAYIVYGQYCYQYLLLYFFCVCCEHIWYIDEVCINTYYYIFVVLWAHIMCQRSLRQYLLLISWPILR